MRRAALLIPVVLCFACAGPSLGQSTFRAAYSPSKDTVLPPLPACAGAPAFAVNITPGATTPPITPGGLQPLPPPPPGTLVVGQRHEQEKPTVSYPINMQGDPRAYTQMALDGAFRRAGPSAGRPAVPVRVDVAQLNLEEKTFYNAEFTGTTVLDVMVARQMALHAGRVASRARARIMVARAAKRITRRPSAARSTTPPRSSSRLRPFVTHSAESARRSCSASEPRPF